MNYFTEDYIEELILLTSGMVGVKKSVFSQQVWRSPFYDWQLLSKFWWFYLKDFTPVLGIVMRNTYGYAVVGGQTAKGYSKETSVKEREVEADGFSNRCFATKHLYPTERIRLHLPLCWVCSFKHRGVSIGAKNVPGPRNLSKFHDENWCFLESPSASFGWPAIFKIICCFSLLFSCCGLCALSSLCCHWSEHWGGVLVCWGWHNTVLQIGYLSQESPTFLAPRAGFVEDSFSTWLKQQKYIFSQYWRLQVWDEGVNGCFLLDPPLGLWLAIFSLCLHMVFSMFLCLFKSSLIKTLVMLD